VLLGFGCYYSIHQEQRHNQAVDVDAVSLLLPVLCNAAGLIMQ
jgi:hypothetical protein